MTNSEAKFTCAGCGTRYTIAPVGEYVNIDIPCVHCGNRLVLAYRNPAYMDDETLRECEALHRHMIADYERRAARANAAAARAYIPGLAEAVAVAVGIALFIAWWVATPS